MTDVTTAVLSTQEAAIASGSKTLRPGVSDRVVRLFDAIRAYGPPRVALERAVYLTESLKTTEGQPLVWRWAKALQHIAENISVATSTFKHTRLCAGFGSEGTTWIYANPEALVNAAVTGVFTPTARWDFWSQPIRASGW